MNFYARAILPLALVACCCSCDHVASVTTTGLPIRQDLPKIRTDRGITGRSAIVLAAGLCVVMHFPPSDLEGVDFDGIQPPSQEEVEAGKSGMRLLPFGQSTTFNCVTFALADALQLSPNDWIEPFARESTFYTDPAQIALDSYFDLVADYPRSDIDWDELSQSSQLRHGDVICYRQTVNNQRAIAHMGRLKETNGRFSTLSKFGVGPIAETSLEYCAEVFMADVISVYRPKRSHKTKSSHKT